MESFIDLMADDVWSETDIKSRLHAEIRSEISEFAETELNRALQGAAFGMHTMTEDELTTLAQFKAATDRTYLLGQQARADMALLHEVFTLEPAQSRLARPKIEPIVENETTVNQLDIDIDVEERALSQSIVDTASEAAVELSLIRNPQSVEVAPELDISE